MTRATREWRRRLREAIDYALLGRAFTGRGAAWIMPDGTVHSLKDEPNYWHTHWIRDPENHHLIPEGLRRYLSTGELDAVGTKLNLQSAGWVRKSRPDAYEVHEPHVERGIALIRAHMTRAHPEYEQFSVDVVGSDGQHEAPRRLPVRARSVTQSAVARARDLDTARSWGASGASLETPAMSMAKNRRAAARAAALQSRRTRRRYEAVEEAYLSYQEIEKRARAAGLGKEVAHAKSSELERGVDAEREHDDGSKLDTIKGSRRARVEALIKIALAHLKERPDYYSRMKKAGID